MPDTAKIVPRADRRHEVPVEALQDRSQDFYSGIAFPSPFLLLLSSLSRRFPLIQLDIVRNADIIQTHKPTNKEANLEKTNLLGGGRKIKQ